MCFRIHKLGILALAMVLAALIGAPTTFAQSSENVDVQVVITSIIAENLNEDSITDDQEDEMVFFYALYEVAPDGRVLQVVDASTEYFFEDEERATGSNFSDLRLVVEPSNDVVFIVYAVEIDTPVTDADAETCGAAAPAAIVECLSGGDCGNLDIELLEQCVADLGGALVASNDDLFENAHVAFIDTGTLGSELADVDVEDKGTNSAEYEVEYTIVTAATSAAPSRNDNLARYLYFGRLEDGEDRAEWPLSLTIGDTATIRATPYSGDLDTAIALIDADGQIVVENDDAENFDTLNAIATYTSRLGGDFTVEASRGDGDTEGNFFVEIVID